MSGQLREALAKASVWCDGPMVIHEDVRRLAREALAALDSGTLTVLDAETVDTIEDDVARALYERAMDERRTFSKSGKGFHAVWETLNPESKRGWQEEARTVLAKLREARSGS